MWEVNFLTTGDSNFFDGQRSRKNFCQLLFSHFHQDTWILPPPNLRLAVRGGPPSPLATPLMQGVFSVNFESFTIYNILGDEGQIIGGGGMYAPIPPGFAALVVKSVFV